MASVAPRLPVGTQVVLRDLVTDDSGQPVQRGATGRVLRDQSDGSYAVKLSDGRLLGAIREQLSLRRAYQQELAIGRTVDGHQLVNDHTIYAVVVGSRAFGLATDTSDTDVRGVYVAPTADFWSLAKPPMHVEGPADEWFSWELERFCELALKANPNVLEVLWSPMVQRLTTLGEELLDIRRAFLSQLAYQTYHGYTLSQFKKLEADLRQHGEPKWKHVMHLLRLLLSARTLLRTGDLAIDVGDQRDALLAVKRGERSWDEVEAWRLSLHRDLDDAMDGTPLPAVPDVAHVDAWLRDVRLRGVPR